MMVPLRDGKEPSTAGLFRFDVVKYIYMKAVLLALLALIFLAAYNMHIKN